MADRPPESSLESPPRLRPARAASGGRLGARPAAAAALALGALTFLLATVTHAQVASAPDARLTLPGLAAAGAAAVASMARREPGGYWLWALGLGLAAAAVVLGWFLMLAIVVGATALAILILHAVM